MWRWSTERLEEFWSSIWEYYEVDTETPYRVVLGSRQMPGADWFPGARLSYAHHVFRGKDSDAIAIRFESELSPLREWTWGQLRQRTAALAAGLKEAGVCPGQRVAAYLPNVPETIVAFLACASLGAIWSACSPDFGEQAVVDRFGQIEPTVLIAVDGYRYGGKDFPRLDVVARLQNALPTLTTTVVLPYLDPNPNIVGLRNTQLWSDFEREGPALTFQPLPFDHPLWVVYSSGTTGAPKPIVHSVGGILLDQLKWLHLHLDAHAEDRIFWFTTTGWIMWNVITGVLLTPASIVIYDGDPKLRDYQVLWDLADEAETTIFGTSPAFIAACRTNGIVPRAGRRLSNLRAVGSTGSPLLADGYRWIYEQLGDDIWLFSMSGGTDVCGPLLGGVPTLPVYLGELQAPVLGVAVEAWDDQGRPLVGEMGELVVTQPMPSMPIYLWGDRDGHLYHESYFANYPAIWRHGDWAELTPRFTGIVHGRSDATINRGGVRIGTSEIYRCLHSLPEIVDALVVDVPLSDHAVSVMPLFIVLRENERLTDELTGRIAAKLRIECSPRHVPDKVFQVAQIPYTLTGKIMEVPVKRILMGHAPEKVVSRNSLANPDALDWFIQSRMEILSAAESPQSL